MSKFERTTPLKSAGGYAGTFTKVFIGPLPNSGIKILVDCRRVRSIVMSG